MESLLKEARRLIGPSTSVSLLSHFYLSARRLPCPSAITCICGIQESTGLMCSSAGLIVITVAERLPDFS